MPAASIIAAPAPSVSLSEQFAATVELRSAISETAVHEAVERGVVRRRRRPPLPSWPSRTMRPSPWDAVAQDPVCDAVATTTADEEEALEVGAAQAQALGGFEFASSAGPDEDALAMSADEARYGYHPSLATLCGGGAASSPSPSPRKCARRTTTKTNPKTKPKAKAKRAERHQTTRERRGARGARAHLRRAWRGAASVVPCAANTVRGVCYDLSKWRHLPRGDAASKLRYVLGRDGRASYLWGTAIFVAILIVAIGILVR
jgi:hypothetical protein